MLFHASVLHYEIMPLTFLQLTNRYTKSDICFTTDKAGISQPMDNIMELSLEYYIDKNGECLRCANEYFPKAVCTERSSLRYSTIIDLLIKNAINHLTRPLPASPLIVGKHRL